MQYQIKL